MLKKILPVTWHYSLSQLKRAVLGYKKFSQYGEDEVLLDLFKGVSVGIYVDVGAHHPYRYSNTYLLFKKGWHGINIDPNPDTIRLFIRARPKDKNICCGVGKEGILTYYQFSDPAINTFVQAEADKWRNKKFVKFLGTKEVQIRPLSQLIEGPVDLLTIDAEGMDLEILESYDWQWYPRAIVVEGEQSRQLLELRGYKLFATRGISNVFIKA